MSVVKYLELLSKEERLSFEKYVKGRSKRSEETSLAYLKAYSNGALVDFKNSIGSNAFNVTGHRLRNLIEVYLAQGVMASSMINEAEVLSKLILARTMITQKEFDLSYGLLSRIKIDAQRIEHYSLVVEILQTMISISEEIDKVDLNDLLSEFERYRSLRAEQEGINVMLANLKHKLNSGHFELKGLFINSTKHQELHDVVSNYEVLRRVIEYVDLAASALRKYSVVDESLFELFYELKSKTRSRYINEEIECGYLLANIRFRQGSYASSLKILRGLDSLIEGTKTSKFVEEVMVKSKVLTVLNALYSGNLAGAMSSLGTYRLGQHPSWDLISSTLYFYDGNYRQVAKILNAYPKSDKFYLSKFGIEWYVNFQTLMILTQIELGNPNVALNMLNKFVHKQKRYIQEGEGLFIKEFIILLKFHVDYPEKSYKSEFEEKVLQLLPDRSVKYDLFFISTYAWLKSKYSSHSAYDVMIELANS